MHHQVSVGERHYQGFIAQLKIVYMHIAISILMTMGKCVNLTARIRSYVTVYKLGGKPGKRS